MKLESFRRFSPAAERVRPTLGMGLALALAVGSGCASYTDKAIRVRETLGRGDFAGARAYLEKEKPGGDGLPYLMELGLVQRLQEDFAASNETFDAAELLVEELYTTSISKQALSLATNDEVIPYSGEAWERVLVNYYRALNYVDLGQFEDALVECRKINHKLKVYADADDSPPTYRTDAFAEYLTALLYEAGGELDDAWVSLRAADEAYAHYETAYGVPPPPSLAQDLLRLSESLGYDDEHRRYRERFPEVTFTKTSELSGKGEIIVFFEEGCAPAKRQETMMLPILRTEFKDGKDRIDLAWSLSARARERQAFEYKKTELEYLLRIAVPTYLPETTSELAGYAVIRVGEASSRSEVTEDVGAIARQGLKDREGKIFFRTILRALGKYAISRGLEKNQGEAAGLIANLVTAATEKADTRSWITLPNTIQIARLTVAPGTHQVELECRGPGGEIEETIDFDPIEIGAGEIKFLSYRSMK